MELTADQILSAQESNTIEVPIPEWGGSIYVRRLTALESLKFFMELRDIQQTDGDVAKSRLIASLAAYVCNFSGKPILSLEQAGRIAAEKSAHTVYRIVTTGHKLNAMDDAGVDALAKNSAPSPAASSPSA